MVWGRALSTPWPFWIRLYQLNFYQQFATIFWRWKLTSIGLIRVTSSLSLIKMSLGGAKDEYFSCFHSSCQLGLKVAKIQVAFSLLSYLQNNERNHCPSTFSHKLGWKVDRTVISCHCYYYKNWKYLLRFLQIYAI